MPDEQTVEDFNAREKRRASIVARLHGYTPWQTGDTEESLKAEYEALTGEAYRSREEEQADNLEAAKERRQQRIETQLDSDRQIISDAKANGFLDCRMIRDGLGWDKPAPNGSYYDPIQTADRWVRDAGEDLVELITHWQKVVPRWEYLGCYPDVFARVLAYKNAYYAKLKHDEWTFNMAQLVEARALEGSKTDLMDWDMAIEALGPEPPAPDAAVLGAVEARKMGKKVQDACLPAFGVARERQAAAADVDWSVSEETILQAMRDYTGPLNKKGYPKGPFMGLKGKAKQALWDRRNE